MGGAPVIIDNEIYDNSEAGIYGVQRTGTVIRKNKIYRNFNGIEASGEQNIDISENEIYENQTGILIKQTSVPMEIKNNNFYKNYYGISFSYQAEVKISGNKLENNGTEILGGFKSRGTILNNKIEANKTGIYFKYGTEGQISQNLIKDNQEAGILCEYSSYPLINQNEIDNKKWDIKLGINESWDWDKEKYPEFQQASSQGLNALNNYWGEKTTAILERDKVSPKIYDYEKEPYFETAGKRYQRIKVKLIPYETKQFISVYIKKGVNK